MRNTIIALLIFLTAYLLAKKPKIDEYGSYKLEDVKGKKEEVKRKG